MPLLFVHGVNVRYDDPERDPFVTARTALFRRFALTAISEDPSKSLVLNPYWGHLGASFPRSHAALPTARYEVFGSDDEIAATLLALEPAAVHDPDAALLSTARTSLESAIDTLWRVASIDLDADLVSDFAQASADIAEYLEENPAPEWLQSVSNDGQWLMRLVEEARRWRRARHAGHAQRSASTALASAPDGSRESEALEVFGSAPLLDRLTGAVERIRDGVVRAGDEMRRAATAGRRPLDDLFLRVRTPMHQTLATFLGDVFVYFRQRESNRRRIAEVVTDALDEAIANRTATGEPLVVVAHSMGGIIMHDLLTSTLSDRTIDVLVTVGSQIAVMEELGMFAARDVNAPKVSKPGNITRWMNVFDTTDILGFAASGVFNDVTDYIFATGHAWAHGGYFVEPMFHRRLGVHLR